ncbi:MAG: acyl-CoA desaturase [Vulcanimicrobiota bacterium]
MPPSQQVEHPPHPWDWRTILVLTVMHLGALAAPFVYTPSAALMALSLYVMSALGITLGYHRLLTHRSYRASPWLERLIVLMGSLSFQAGPAAWVAIHRSHHARSDREGDPHSRAEGFWWSHVGWMLYLTPRRLDDSYTRRLARDILANPFYAFLDRHYFKLCLGTGWLLFILGGWSWLVWGMFLRVALVFHATWLVNSAAHTFGYRSYATGDRSTNCWWVALLTMGEGWHNNHHAFPTSARHGLRWYEFDLTWLVISGLERAGLAWDVKLPRLETSREGGSSGSNPEPWPPLDSLTTSSDSSRT